MPRTPTDGRTVRHDAIHRAISATLAERCGINVYFADPRSPWQRPTDETGSGLIRRSVGEIIDLATFIIEVTSDDDSLDTIRIHGRSAAQQVDGEAVAIIGCTRRPISRTPVRETVSHPLVMMGRMDLAAVVEQVQQVAAVRTADASEREQLESALRGVGRLEAWLAGTKAAITSKLAAQVSFPEKTIADCTRGSTRDAMKERERADTLTSAPGLASALDDARVTAGHVDEVTRATKSLDGDQRSELFDRLSRGLLDVAAVATVAEWRRRLASEVKNIQRDDGLERLERQRQATSLRTWTDGDGMWCLSGRFDPVTGVKMSAAIDAAVNALFAEQTPATCPVDPVDKQRHLAALALAELADGRAVGARPGRPEYVVVIDSSQDDGAGGPVVDWGLPVEVPQRVLGEMMGDGRVEAVVVRNGVVLHAPGQLDLGRTTRLANRAQRRALRTLYATCAIPGCSVRYDRCKLHHITWWRHGGRTDLDNLLPVCAHHHTKIHDHGWDITLGPNRELTLRLPDGTIHNTGPPTRRAA